MLERVWNGCVVDDEIVGAGGAARGHASRDVIEREKIADLPCDYVIGAGRIAAHAETTDDSLLPIV